MIRYLFFAAAALSPFLFSFPMTLALSFAAGMYAPLVPFFIGVMTDLLYYTPGAYAWPLASSIGLVLTGVVFMVRRFLKARIMQ